MSAVAELHGMLLIGVDEIVGKKKKKSNVIQLLRRRGDGYERVDEIRLCRLNDDGRCIKPHRKEMDIEAIAVQGETVYVMGSHSVARRKIDAKKNDYRKNRARLLANGREDAGGVDKSGWRKAESRERLLRFRLSDEGMPSGTQEISLADMLDNVPPLRPFRSLPSKENGVDIEGLAIKGNVLIAGFRAPVFNNEFAIVVRFDFDAVASGEDQIDPGDILFLRLEGLGIRSLASVSDGFLLLAGPPGQAPGPYRIYHWNGIDMVPGAGSPGGVAHLVTNIPTSGQAKPEGLVVFEETGEGYEIGIVEDSADEPVLRRFRIAR
ncbi:MAG: DUF3616 domain-containing protein [Rhizobiaceae bacterium]